MVFRADSDHCDLGKSPVAFDLAHAPCSFELRELSKPLGHEVLALQVQKICMACGFGLSDVKEETIENFGAQGASCRGGAWPGHGCQGRRESKELDIDDRKRKGLVNSQYEVEMLSTHI